MSHNSPYTFQSTFTNITLPPFVEISACLDLMRSDYGREVRSIGFIFASDSEVLAINQKHLNHDYLTDVITFPYGKNPIEAEIYISVDRVKANALSYEVPFIEEFARVMLHGVLHLLGEKDGSEEDKARMTLKENHYLGQIPFGSIKDDYQAIWPFAE